MLEQPLYLYCVAEGAEAPRLGEGLFSVSVDGLHAVVRPVDTADFAPLQTAGGELSPELAELLVGHDQIIRAVFATHNLLPMRFGVAVAGVAALERYLREQAAALRGALDRVRGCAEWGVRWEPPPVAAPTVNVPPESGSGYLRRRQSEAQERQRTGAEFRRLAEAGHQALKALAAESQADAAAGGGRLGAVYLVPHAAGDAFLATAGAHSEALAASGAGLRGTGPWPPYSFCDGLGGLME